MKMNQQTQEYPRTSQTATSMTLLIPKPENELTYLDKIKDAVYYGAATALGPLMIADAAVHRKFSSIPANPYLAYGVAGVVTPIAVGLGGLEIALKLIRITATHPIKKVRGNN